VIGVQVVAALYCGYPQDLALKNLTLAGGWA
jgi:hypothetical protein